MAEGFIPHGPTELLTEDFMAASAFIVRRVLFYQDRLLILKPVAFLWELSQY